MIKRVPILVTLALLAAPALAQKVHIDYDMSAPFSTYKTVAWAETEATSVADTAPLLHAKIKEAIEAQIKSGNMVGADEDPDLYVTYHTDEKEELSLNTVSYGYGYPGSMYWDPYWGGGWGMAASSSHVYSYTRGTLIIDFWDAKTEKLVWRGSAEAVIKENPQKLERQIIRWVQKIAKKWDKMHGQNTRKREREAEKAAEG